MTKTHQVMKAQLLETWPRDETSCTHHDKNNLELSLGMPSTSYRGENHRHDSKGGATVAAPTEKKVLCRTGPVLHHVNGGLGSKMSSWFSGAGAAGFVHPWSLAARQEKAASEQKHLKANLGRRPPPPPCDIMRGPQPAPVVGWPPVRASRKNLASPRPSKSSMEVEEKEAKKSKTSELEENKEKGKEDSAKFVKVNMEGLTVGRKIDLMAHDGYESLSLVVRKMFDSFLSVKYSNRTGRNEHGELEDADLVLLYEDIEGDKMLVGDVPWKMFVGSVKRLYITFRTKTYLPVNGDPGKKENEQYTKLPTLQVNMLC